MPRTSLRKKQAVSYNEDRDDDEMPKPTMAKAVAVASKIVEKANGTVSKTAVSKVVSTKTSTKRKAEPEAESAAPAPAPAAKVTKKRKTKAKDEDETPLANRTAVSELKPAMHIGAHVSAAGGTYISSPAVFASY
jgi:AP endonuclease-1